MGEQLTKDEIKAAVSEAIEAKLGDFFIERETHYQDHMFIKSLRDVLDTSRGEVCKQMAGAFVKVVFFLSLLGLVAWIVMVKKVG